MKVGCLKPDQLRQAANDTYCKTLTFKVLQSQLEPVESGIINYRPASTSSA